MRKPVTMIVVFLLMGVLLLACAPVSVPPTATPALPTQMLAPPTAPMPTPTTARATATPRATTAAQPSVTKIIIDGDPSDWVGREAVRDDSAGDAEAGFLDLTTGYAFVNRHALYLLVKTVDPKAKFVQFDLVFQSDAKRLQISWAPSQPNGFVADVTGGHKPIGDSSYSAFALGPALEARVDLRDLGSPQSVRVTEIRVMVGNCCQSPAWRAADQWQSSTTPVVNEIDSPRLVSDEPRYALARRFNLPEGYVATRIFVPPTPDLNAIARSQSGVIYLQHDRISSGLSILDPTTGKVTRILDLPNTGVPYVVGGPADSALISVLGEIWQVRPNGSYTVWAKRSEGRPRYFTADGHLLGISQDSTRVVQFLPDGSAREIAVGFSQIYDIVAAPDGTIFVADGETGDITRIDSNGTKRVLVKRVLYRDPLDLEIDPAGRLFLNSVASGFVQIDANTGTMARFRWADSPCTIHPADFVFATPNRVLFMDPTWSQVTYADFDSQKSGLLVSNQGANTWAAAIGPGEALYVGAWGCGDEIPAQIVRIGDDGTRTVYVDKLRGEVRDLAFAPDGAMYVATFERGQGTSLFYVPPKGGPPVLIPGTQGGNILSIAVDPISGHLFASEHNGSAILEFTREGLQTKRPIQLSKAVFDFHIDITPDGTLYAYCSESERQQTGPIVERWVLRIDLKTGATKNIAQIDRQGCCVMGNLAADPQGNLWWVVDPEFRIYRVTPDGKATLFAENLPIDPAAAAVNRRGYVYFTSPSGIYRIYQEP